MKSKIRLYNLELFGYHGVNDQEIKKGQKFEIDIELSVDTGEAIQTDDISIAVDYSKVYKQVVETFSSNRYNLIETLAANISESIMTNILVLSCKITIRKPNAPIDGKFDTVEVEYFENA